MKLYQVKKQNKLVRVFNTRWEAENFIAKYSNKVLHIEVFEY